MNKGYEFRRLAQTHWSEGLKMVLLPPGLFEGWAMEMDALEAERDEARRVARVWYQRAKDCAEHYVVAKYNKTLKWGKTMDAENEVLKEDLSEVLKALDMVIDERDDAYEENERLREAVGGVEWVLNDEKNIYYCPWCFYSRKHGHADSCPRQRALGFHPKDSL